MGHSTTASIDTAALITVADRFDDVAMLLERAGRSRLGFDGAHAGTAHTAGGDAVRRGTEQLLLDVASWARAAGEIGVALRNGARRYRDADEVAAGGLSR